MWNLSGDDIARAKAELTSRRAAIQAKYDRDIQQLADDLATLENFERAAVSLASKLKSDEGAEPGNDGAGDAAEKGSSRWRMRLGAGDGSPAGGNAA